MPLHRKLAIKSGQRLALLGAPLDFAIPDLPESVRVRRSARGPLDVIIAFFGDRAALERRLPALVRALRSDGSLWLVWPRKAAGHVSDVSENLLRELVLPLGLVDVKVAALDEDWSALRFVWRREMRERLRA